MMAGDLTASVGARVEEIMATAQQAAENLQREVEEASGAPRHRGAPRRRARRPAHRRPGGGGGGRHLEGAPAPVQTFADIGGYGAVV